MGAPSRQARRVPATWADERLILGASLLLLTLLYAALAARLAGFGAFWSPDSGARFAMIRSWLEHGSPVYLPYSRADVDPEGHLHYLSGYAIRLPRGFCTVYSPLFPLLSGVFYRLLGFGGLVLLPLLGGLGAVVVTYATARRLGLRSRCVLVVALGLATPLVLYSGVFWDHSLHMLLVATVGYCLLRALEERRARWAAGAGALLGSGVWFQELFAVAFVAVFLAAVPLLSRRKDRALVLGLAAGFLPLAAAWAGTNWAIYGVLGGPHTLGPNQLTHPYHLGQMLSPDAFVRRSLQQLVGDPALGPLVPRFGLVILVSAPGSAGGCERSLYCSPP